MLLHVCEWVNIVFVATTCIVAESTLSLKASPLAG